jgi:site-specific DNA-cytosine methylase
MTLTTCATLFSGGEGAGVGLQAAGLRHCWGVEYDPAIAAVAQRNGFDVMVADVRAVDYTTLAPVDWLHASPVCTRASNANPNATCGRMASMARTTAAAVSMSSGLSVALGLALLALVQTGDACSQSTAGNVV